MGAMPVEAPRPRGQGVHPRGRGYAWPGQAMVNLPIRSGRTMF
jgi:hypothetical protein